MALTVAIIWFVACKLISAALRKRSVEATGFSSTAAHVFRWLAPIGVVIICGVDLMLKAIGY